MSRSSEIRRASTRPRVLIDWTEVRRRVEEAGEAAASGRRTPAVIRDILEQRARRLAEPRIAASGDAIDAIRFGLAGELYAIAAENVSGVFPLRTLTAVPGAREPVLGITEWRGDLLTILDLRRLLALPVPGLNDLSMVIALGGERPAFGVLADTLIGIASIRTDDLYRRESSPVETSSHVHGLTDDATIVLNGDSLLGRSPTKSE